MTTTGRFNRAPIGGEEVYDASEIGARRIWKVNGIEGSGTDTKIVLSREGDEKKVLLQDFKRRHLRI